jgi:hypothetical protein
MRWIYILQCEHYKTNEIFYYVGKTKRLCTRFYEHIEKKECLNTSIYRPCKLIALYSLDRLGLFNEFIKTNKISILKDLNNIGYNNYEYNGDSKEECFLENLITESMMINNKKIWMNIRGGKYVRFDIEYKFPLLSDILNILPVCDCGLPCDIKVNQNNKLYFRCAKSNLFNNLQNKYLNNVINVSNNSCNFIKNYVSNNDEKFMKRKEILRNLFKKSSWLSNIPIQKNDNYSSDYCICSQNIVDDSDYKDDKYNMFKSDGCENWELKDMISYNNNKLRLCYDCFIKFNNELKDKFTIDKVYLFKKK